MVLRLTRNERRKIRFLLLAPVKFSCYDVFINKQTWCIMSASQRKTLVLNADYRPLSVYPLSFISAEEAIKTVYRDRAVVVEEWPDVFRSPSVQICVPKIIALRTWAPVNSSPKFCRRSILLRDRFRCQYCGEKFSAQELSYDHVVPRAKGGQTVWENIVAACLLCNAAKQDKMPKHSGRKGAKGGFLRPLKEPRQPTTAELLRAGMEFIEPEILEDFGSYLYWNVELEK